MQALQARTARAPAAAAGPCRSAVTRPRLYVRAQATTSLEPRGNVCRTCGIDLSQAPGGCDGEGRIMGGLAAVPGFGWWPIKAYRPCSALAQAGLEYTRKGQGTNEMLFGGVSLGASQQRSMDAMKDVADKGLEVEVAATKSSSSSKQE